jgi:hypothetical protein
MLFALHALDVNWNGNVPLCTYSAQQIGAPGLILGNVMTDMLGDIWNGNVIRHPRRATTIEMLAKCQSAKDAQAFEAGCTCKKIG